MSKIQQTKESEQMADLIEKLAAGIDHGRGRVFTFEEVLERCRQLPAFEWRFLGNFTNNQNRSSFGRLLAQHCDCTFVLSDGRRVEFSRRGSDQKRWFAVKIL